MDYYTIRSKSQYAAMCRIDSPWHMGYLGIMNAKLLLFAKLLKLVGIHRDGVYRVDSGKYTILWRNAIMNEGIDGLAVGPTEDLCTTCRGEGEIPGSWVYYPCVPCKGTGFLES